MYRFAPLGLLVALTFSAPAQASNFTDVKLLRLGAVATLDDCAVDGGEGEDVGTRCVGRRYPRAQWPFAVSLRCSQSVTGISIRVSTVGRVHYRGRLRVLTLASNEDAAPEFDLAGGSDGETVPSCPTPGSDSRRELLTAPETIGVPSVTSGSGVSEAWYSLRKRLGRVKVTMFGYDARTGRRTSSESFILRIPRDRWARQCFTDAAAPMRVLANPDPTNKPPALASFVETYVNARGTVRVWPGGVDRGRFGGAAPIDDAAEQLGFGYALDGRPLEVWPARQAPGLDSEEYERNLALYPGAVVSVPNGQHTLTVRAADSRGGVSEQSVLVRCASTRKRGWPFNFRPGGYRP